MGQHAHSRIEHDKKIAAFTSELASFDAGIQKETTAESKIDADISKLALKAASGDRDALRKQRELHDKKSEHQIQRRNLESLAAPIRENIAKAESDLPNLVVAEAKEALAEQIAALPVLAAELSKTILPIATSFEDFRKQFDHVVARALPLISDDPERIAPLQDRVRVSIVRGLRAQLCADFDRAGLHLFEASQFEGSGFEGVVRPVLESLISALGISLPSSAADRTSPFRATTNISGLHGLKVSAGEILSLRADHPEILKLVALGSLVAIDARSEEAA